MGSGALKWLDGKVTTLGSKTSTRAAVTGVTRLANHCVAFLPKGAGSSAIDTEELLSISHCIVRTNRVYQPYSL